MQVLVIDDSHTIRLRVSKHLKDWGFEARSVADGFEALELLEDGTLPRLLIVDWVMPKLEGPEVIREIRKHDPDRHHYIIMLTAKVGREVLETAFRCGADDYLAKPIVEDELHRRICEGRNILERHDQVLSTNLSTS